MERIEVNSANALHVAEVVLTHIGEPAHFTRIGQIAANLGYVYNGTAQKGDLGTFLRVAMWNDTNGDDKAAKSKFVRCANRVYRLRDQAEPAGFASRNLVPRKGVVKVTTNAAPIGGGNMGDDPRITGRAPRIEPVAAMVAIALNKPIEDKGAEEVREEQSNEENAAVQAQALEDMRKLAEETGKKLTIGEETRKNAGKK